MAKETKKENFPEQTEFKEVDYSKFEDDFTEEIIFKLYPDLIPKKFVPLPISYFFLPVETFTPSHPSSASMRGIEIVNGTYTRNYSFNENDYGSVRFARLSLIKFQDEGRGINVVYNHFSNNKYLARFYLVLEDEITYHFKTKGSKVKNVRKNGIRETMITVEMTQGQNKSASLFQTSSGGSQPPWKFLKVEIWRALG